MEELGPTKVAILTLQVCGEGVTVLNFEFSHQNVSRMSQSP
jgi:hypothetical protein